jgi:hypothetical protein
LIDEDGEVRELTLADIRRMKPIREVMPELIEAVEQHRKKLGRPRSESPKVHYRLPPERRSGRAHPRERAWLQRPRRGSAAQGRL